MSDTPYMQHSALDKASDAPSLTSLLAEMRLHIESFAALRVWGATPKAQTMAQEAVDRTTNAVLDLVRGLRERAETAARERDEALAACESLKDAHHRASVRIGELADQYEAVAVGTGNTRPLPEGMAGVSLATPGEIVAEWRRILRERAEMMDEVRGLQAKAEELLRLLRVAMHGDRCEHTIGEEEYRFQCNAPAVFATDGPHGPVEESWCAEHVPRWMKYSEHPQAADVRRIAELLGEASDG